MEIEIEVEIEVEIENEFELELDVEIQKINDIPLRPLRRNLASLRLNTRMKFNRKGRKVERKGRGEFEIENESELELEVEIQKINDIPLRPLRRILASLRLITRMKFNFKGRKVERKGRGEFEIENEV